MGINPFVACLKTLYNAVVNFVALVWMNSCLSSLLLSLPRLLPLVLCICNLFYRVLFASPSPDTDRACHTLRSKEQRVRMCFLQTLVVHKSLSHTCSQSRHQVGATPTWCALDRWHMVFGLFSARVVNSHTHIHTHARVCIWWSLTCW